MSLVTCFQIEGLRCWFYSNDHAPPHFHVQRPGEWELRVYFLEDAGRMFEVKWGAAPKSRMLRRLAGLVEENRLQLLVEWETKVVQ